MANPARYGHSNSDPSDETGVPPEGNSITGTPRWVKVFGIVALVTILLFIILMFTRGPGGRGGHTPFRHFGSQVWPSSVIADHSGGRNATLEGRRG